MNLKEGQQVYHIIKNHEHKNEIKKILNEEIAEMEKEIESIFNNTIIEEEFLTMEGK